MHQAQRSFSASTRKDSRHVIGRFVAPGTKAGAKEGFMVVDLSSEGMSLLRVAPKAEAAKRGLDHRFSWLAVPLPEREVQICALTEVVHRKRFGPLEMIGVRFEQMSKADRTELDTYLAERERLSFGARRIRA